MPDFCEASATNGNGSPGANFTAGGCEVVPVRLAPNQPREAGDSVWETEHVRRTSLMHRFSLAAGINARLV